MGAALEAADWKPIDPAELALKAPMVDKGADAETLFWDVWVTDEFDGSEIHSVLNHYLRIKIFTERGKETQGKVNILGAGRTKIASIAARTIKPDGGVLELEKGSIFDRVLAQAEGLRIRAKSFAMPGVEPGAIIEYRWQETRADQVANYVRLEFQRDIPVQRVTYHVKPLTIGGVTLGMNSIRFHMPEIEWVRETGGYSKCTMTGVPAFRREPDMPPDNQVRSWMLVYYTTASAIVPQRYWQEYGKDRYRTYKAAMKVDGEIKSAAAKAIAGAKTDDEKLKRLFDFCRAQVKNKSDRDTGLTAEERAALKVNKTPADTLRQGYGSAREIDLLFGALAIAAGFDARYALVADRSDVNFSPKLASSYFLNTHNIAVLVNDKWQFFHPSSTRVPFGMLSWQQEGADAFIPDPKEPFFVKTALSDADKSAIKHKAVFKLDAKGTLEGDVTVEYSGHRAEAHRRTLAGESAEQMVATVSRPVKARFRSAVVTNAKVENAADLERPLVESYHVRVTGYAQRTGKRLLLPLAFFERNVAARYPNSERMHAVYFRHPWLEEDSVSIELPEGFETESADAPSPIPFAPVGEYNVKVGITKDKRKLVYTRIFAMGRNGQIQFQPEVYPRLKKLFDAMHDQDQHMIGLKAVESGQ